MRCGWSQETIRWVGAVLVTEWLALRRFTADHLDGLLALYYARYRDFGFWAADFVLLGEADRIRDRDY